MSYLVVQTFNYTFTTLTFFSIESLTLSRSPFLIDQTKSLIFFQFIDYLKPEPFFSAVTTFGKKMQQFDDNKSLWRCNEAELPLFVSILTFVLFWFLFCSSCENFFEVPISIVSCLIESYFNYFMLIPVFMFQF